MLSCFRRAVTLILCSSLSALLGAQTPSNSTPGSKDRPSPAKPQTSARPLMPVSFQAAKALQPGVQSQSIIAMGSRVSAAAPLLAAPALPSAQPVKPDSSGMFAVDYQAGQLSVVADKAELGKLMKLLGEKIGASVEVSADVATEPVVARLGPAAPNQILAQLLDSSHLAYIVMGSDENGLGIQRIVVHKRTTSGGESLMMARRQTAPVAQPEPEKAEPEHEQPIVVQPAADEPPVQPRGSEQQGDPPQSL